jgi:hypothetical protein
MYRVPKWSDYQGYRKRGPSWVKLHVSLLRKREWLKLPLSGKALLPALWIIASESGVDGSLPNDHEILAHLSGVAEPALSEGINALISFGFIDSDKTVADLATKLSGEERRGEREGERKGDSPAKAKTAPVYVEPPMPSVTTVPSWEAKAKEIWARHLGGENDYVFADLVPVVRRFGEEKTLSGWDAYCRSMVENQGGKFASARSFAQKPGPWIPKAERPRLETIEQIKARELA